MRSELLVAIDVGKSGGVAWSTEGSTLCENMPKSEGELVQFFNELKLAYEAEASGMDRPPVVFIEKVSGFIGTAHPGSHMFKFGEGFGFIKGVLHATGWKINLVRPQEWMRALGLVNSDKLPKNKWKNRLKDEAARLYPKHKPTLATADALLILEYARRAQITF